MNPDMQLVRRDRCHLSEQTGWEPSWRAPTSGWRRRGRDPLNFCCRWHIYSLSHIMVTNMIDGYIYCYWWPLASQVNMLQKSLLSQNEEQRRISAMEQQVTHDMRLNHTHKSSCLGSLPALCAVSMLSEWCDQSTFRKVNHSNYLAVIEGTNYFKVVIMSLT